MTTAGIIPHFSEMTGDNSVGPQRFAVEFGRRVVGIAVRISGGFVFYSSDRRFDQLNGQQFPRAKTIFQRLQDLSKARQGTKKEH